MEAGIDQVSTMHPYMAAWGFLSPIPHTHPLSGTLALIKTGRFKSGEKRVLRHDKISSGAVPGDKAAMAVIGKKRHRNSVNSWQSNDERHFFSAGRGKTGQRVASPRRGGRRLYLQGGVNG